MLNINSATELRDAILQLESKQEDEGKMLKENFQITYESIKPINLIKSTLNEITASQDLKDNLLNTAAGLTAGYLSKKLFVGVSHNPLKKLLGTALMYGITNLVAKHPETIKSVGNGILNLIRSLPCDCVHGNEKNEVEEATFRN